MLLQDVLDGTAPARLVLVHHSIAAPAWPLLHELTQRAQERRVPLLSINVLPSAAGSSKLAGSSSGANKVLDLSLPPGYGGDGDVLARVKEACRNLAPGTQVLLDAPNVLADDYGTTVVLRVVRAILAAVGSLSLPGRLVTALPSSDLFTDMTSATLSSSLALLYPHHPLAVETAARAELVPTSNESGFWSLLNTSTANGDGDSLALRAADGVEVAPRDHYVLQVLLRKATGGAKGMQRSTEAIKCDESQRWSVVALDEIVHPFQAVASTTAASAAGTTHADLNLPFNLSLTDRQRAERCAVPLPYAHEGEGTDLGMGMDWSDDEEDDEF